MKGKKKEQQDRKTQEDQEEPLEERESNFSGQNENTLEGKKTATLEGPKKTLEEPEEKSLEGTAEPDEEKVLDEGTLLVERPPIEWSEPKRERKIMTNTLLLNRKQRKEKRRHKDHLCSPEAHLGNCHLPSKEKEKEGEGVKKIGERHRCPSCGEAFRKLPTMLLHVREDHADEEGVQVKEEDNTEVKEQDEAEKMLCESEKVEKEGPAKEVGENLETTVHEDVIEEMPKEEEKAEEVIKSPTKEVKSPESPIKEVESPESPMQEVDQKMAEDMDDIINMCKEIDAKKEAEKELEKLGKVEIAKTEEEELGGGDLSQEEDEDDRTSQCKHCGVDMVIESELKKHILLRYSNHQSLAKYQPQGWKMKK